MNSFSSKVKSEGGNTPRQSPRQSPRQPKKKTNNNKKRSSFLDSNDINKQGSSNNLSSSTMRRARSMNYIETLADDSDAESVSSARYSDHGYVRVMRKKKVTFSNPLIIPSSNSTAMVVPFSNDDMDLYDNSFNDDNLSKFIPAAPRTKRRERIDRSKRFIVLTPSILKKTATVQKETRKKPGQGYKRGVPERGSGFVSQQCLCTIS